MKTRKREKAMQRYEREARNKHVKTRKREKPCIRMNERQVRMKKCIIIMGVIWTCFVLNGCQRVEPEVRAYPLAIGIDHTGASYRIYYAMPDMATYTGEDKSAGKHNLLWVYEGTDFKEIEKQVRSSREQLLDLGHVQVILFSEALLNSGQPYEEVLKYLNSETALGSGAYVFSCSSLDEIMHQNGEMTDSLGEYLVDLVDKEQGVEQRERPKTLQKLYNAWYNGEPVPKLLKVVLEENYIKVMESDKE